MNSTALAVAGTSNPLNALSADQMHAHVQRIQQVMAHVMKDKVHYGTIPGAGDRKSLFKAGAEVLQVTFHIAPSYVIEDLSDHDCIRYRLKCIGTHQGLGLVLGEGVGEASSNEEKYKWRNVVCDEEFDLTPVDRRRVKFQRGQNGVYQRKMIRTEPADMANTVLKMASKRAQVAMVINVTAASDIFGQDLEDLPDGTLDGGDGGQNQQRRGNNNTSKSGTRPPQSRSHQGNQQQRHSNESRPAATGQQDTSPKVDGGAIATLIEKMQNYGVGAPDLCKHFNIASIHELPAARMREAVEWVESSNEAGARG